MPSKSPAQERLMEAAAHHREGYGGVPQNVGEEFIRADHANDGSTPYLAAGIIFVAPDGDVLLLRRSNTERNYAGHWALPGGKAEHGEDAVTAAERESHEEIGHVPVGEDPVLIDEVSTPNGFNFSTFMKTVERKFTPTLNDEHSGFCWAPLGELLPNPLHPGVKRVLRSLAREPEPAQDEKAKANARIAEIKRQLSSMDRKHYHEKAAELESELRVLESEKPSMAADALNTDFFVPTPGKIRNSHFFMEKSE